MPPPPVACFFLFDSSEARADTCPLATNVAFHPHAPYTAARLGDRAGTGVCHTKVAEQKAGGCTEQAAQTMHGRRGEALQSADCETQGHPDDHDNFNEVVQHDGSALKSTASSW